MWKDDLPGGGKGTYVTEKGDQIDAFWIEGRIVVRPDEHPLVKEKGEELFKLWEDMDEEEKSRLLMIDLSLTVHYEG